MNANARWFNDSFCWFGLKSRTIVWSRGLGLPNGCINLKQVYQSIIYNKAELKIQSPKKIEYIRGEFTRKKCKTAILLYCFHTAGVLNIFMLYNLLGPGIWLYRKSKINIKRKPIYEIGWFHNWPMIISHRLNDDVFYSTNSL